MVILMDFLQLCGNSVLSPIAVHLNIPLFHLNVCSFDFSLKQVKHFSSSLISWVKYHVIGLNIFISVQVVIFFFWTLFCHQYHSSKLSFYLDQIYGNLIILFIRRFYLKRYYSRSMESQIQEILNTIKLKRKKTQTLLWLQSFWNYG